MSNINIYQIEKNTEDIRRTVLANIVKMFTERKMLNSADLEKNIDAILKLQSDDLIYSMKLNNERTLSIKIVFQKITAMNKSYGITDFLDSFQDDIKIIVVRDISKKAYMHIYNNYPNTEIFLEKNLMINLIEHVLVPKHELLAENEYEDFFEKYHCKKRNIPKLYTTDPVAKYYNMKPGNICRILRPSEKSGYVVSYRIVVKGSLK